MPYHTTKVKGGVKNINKETGKATSKKPMTKMNAEKQKKAIAISEKKKKDPKEKKPDMKEKEKPKKDMKKGKELTEAQEKRLKEHSKKHGGMKSAHMKDMIKSMKDGDTFAKAHKKAMEHESMHDNSKGLTEKQKNLPKKLQEAIMKKKAKK